MLLVDDLAAGGTKKLRHTPRGLVTLQKTIDRLVGYRRNNRKYHCYGVFYLCNTS